MKVVCKSIRYGPIQVKNSQLKNPNPNSQHWIPISAMDPKMLLDTFNFYVAEYNKS